MGVSWGTVKMRSPKTPPQLDLKLKSAPFQFGNVVLQDCQLAAGGCLAGCCPAAWLAGWPQAGPPANQLADGQENQHGDWRTGNCLAGLSVFA